MTRPALLATPRREAALAVAAMLLALVAWLWPLGVGGRMPVGGDVTRFSIGLMAELGRAYRALRLPLWNDLWGYGFPGLAESQMGVYYPLHVVLYGLLPTETAYTASLVLHTFWGALGTYWAARRFGAGAIGAALGGFAWAASGFFVIHLPHQWGYTVGSWMPWAWGLAWPLARGAGNLRQALALAAVLALQILPGHFQLAFITEVGVLGLALWGLVEHPAGWKAALWGTAGIGLALLAVVPLDAMQLWPTYELARLAESRRDYEYLSGFAAPPLHLVSYIAPGLFHASPLWRPVAWDPFHTSPEEHMPYIGLAPLILALVSLRRSWRTDPAVRALGWLALGATLLSLGPYVPVLFRGLIRLPGFSFFRAPARWALAAELALALLAAKGFSASRGGGRDLVAAAVAVGLSAGAVAGMAELALRSLRQPADGLLASALEGMMAWTPWGNATPLRATMGRVMGPPDDPLIVAGLLKRGEDPARTRLLPNRRRVYVEELTPSAVLLAGVLAAVALTGTRPRARAGALLAGTLVDLAWFGHDLRPVETAPARPLASQSTILGAMTTLPRGTRVADGQGNLAMLVGLAPLPPYRTLDRPIQEDLTRTLSASPVVAGSGRLETGQILGIGLHVYSQLETPVYLRGGSIFAPWSAPIEMVDPELARWTYGTRGLALLGPLAAEYRYWPAPYTPTRAWLRDPGVTTLSNLTDYLPRATPGGTFTESPGALVRLDVRSPTPERMEIDVPAEKPGTRVLVTVLEDPEWQASWLAEGAEPGDAIDAPFDGTGGGWIERTVPGPGRWTLRLVYRGQSAYRGLAISMVSWMVFGVSFAWVVHRERHRRKPNEANGPDGKSGAVPDHLRVPNEPNRPSG